MSFTFSSLTSNVTIVPPKDVSIAREGAIITPTEDDIFTMVKAWINSALNDLVPVVRGQQNRVAEPTEDDWVEITPGLRQRTGTNATDFFDPVIGFAGGPPYALGQRVVWQPTQVDIQVDVHGPNGAQNVSVITALFRDLDACDFLQSLNPNVTALFTSEPQQLAFINEGNQFEDRWSVDLSLQVNFSITRPQTFAAVLSVQSLYPNT